MKNDVTVFRKERKIGEGERDSETFFAKITLFRTRERGSTERFPMSITIIDCSRTGETERNRRISSPDMSRARSPSFLI